MRIPHKPEWLMWDHNVHYHPFLLQHIPSGAKRALDVGCGGGRFATRLAERVPEVVAVDRDPGVIAAAQETAPAGRIQFIEADIMDTQLPLAPFDFVSCIAALHHVPLEPGLERLRSLVAPGGVLVVLGLYRLSTPFDYAYASVTGLIDLAVGVLRHRKQPDINAAGGIVLDPQDSLPEIRRAAKAILPRATVRRHMYDRYSLVYSPPRTVQSR